MADDGHPRHLLTALQHGQSAALDHGAMLTVTGSRPDGFAVRIEPGALPWTTVSEGRSRPGAPVTAVVNGQNRITLFIADPNGGIYTSTKLLRL